ncbi:hypothetical protein EVAR_11320_1 [Eumeta japonica]|uniref:Uncharacterized protein n=1 Tax=Eumeta variegata TaxID=151549 RepID=A0A4C1U113_EUMVA|nr:hypothetical protein EVAR_11320_1 [Eumeta japonica]
MFCLAVKKIIKRRLHFGEDPTKSSKSCEVKGGHSRRHQSYWVKEVTSPEVRRPRAGRARSARLVIRTDCRVINKPIPLSSDLGHLGQLRGYRNMEFGFARRHRDDPPSIRVAFFRYFFTPTSTT